MVFGLMLSRERWFWAVLAAFLVFTNTRSRGDTAVKALQRSAGTLAGIVVGLAAASAIGGTVYIVLPLGAACIFLAFYFLPVSYATMTFFVSVVLSLAYSLLGVLTPQLLELRLEETLVGSVAGAAVAFVVFPTKTRTTLDAAIRNWWTSSPSCWRRQGGGRPALISSAGRRRSTAPTGNWPLPPNRSAFPGSSSPARGTCARRWRCSWAAPIGRA
ncbi:hypothetical protein T190_17520 [Sinorhizobium meliloti CCBAU 01290]|nr:hypothetical protein T190_17520 [Sinorhizobium meliloti CCBAU 01290]